LSEARPHKDGHGSKNDEKETGEDKEGPEPDSAAQGIIFHRNISFRKNGIG
jgi:hypothetical protein